MAFGDRDLRVFFRQGYLVRFGGVSTYADGQPVQGNFARAAQDAEFGSLQVEDSRYTLELPYNAFTPMPKSKDWISVDGPFAGTYKVRKVEPEEDGLTVMLHLELH